MNRLLSSIATVIVVSLALAATSSAQSQTTLSPIRAVFPDRAFVLSLPTDTYLDVGDVQVRENGELVKGVSVMPAGAAEGGTVGVALVIDASLSMRGGAIEGAVAAARAFAAQRIPNQKVAVVAFNSTTSTVLPFTADGGMIAGALAQPPSLSAGTHVYDAVGTALGLVEQAKIAVGSVVVLSDGADTGSGTSEAAVIARAAADRVRIFSVGLRGRNFRPELLESMARATGGAYSEATSAADLEHIFAALGGQLAHEYLIQYRSQAEPKRTVHVSVSLAGTDGVLESIYQSPAGAVGHEGPFHRSFSERFWRSTAGMLATSVGAAIFLALAVAAVLRQPRRTLRRRMAEFVSVALTDGTQEPRSTDAVLGRAEKPLERTPWWIKFKEELELADIRTPATHIVAATAIASLMAMWILTVLGGTVLFGVFGLIVPFVVRAVIKRKVERKRRLFGDQLPDNLQVLSSALRAGHSLVGALSVVVEDCPEPSRSEFRRIISDEQLGVPLEAAFGAVAYRMESRDLEQVALVATLQRETGGNTAEVLDRVADTVRSRFELRRLVKTLTTQGRMSRWVVSLLPVGLLLLITAINPGYMEPLYTHVFGRILLVVAGVMVVTGSLVIKRIIDIKV
jgi:tight adherence protein B